MNRKKLFFTLTACLLAVLSFQSKADELGIRSFASLSQEQEPSGPFFDLRKKKLSERKAKEINDILSLIMVEGEPIQTYFVVYPPYIQAPGVEVKRKAMTIDASMTESHAIVAMSLWGVYDYATDKVLYSLDIVASKRAERLIGERLGEADYALNAEAWRTEMLEAAKEAQATDKDDDFLLFLARQFSQRIGGEQQDPGFFIEFQELQAKGRLDRHDPKQQALASQYESLTAGGKTAKVPWLSVESGISTEAAFELPTEAKASFEKNIFLNLNGQTVAHAKAPSKEKQFKFSVTASGDMATTELKAQYGVSADNAPYTVGQLNLASYNEKSFTVVVVPAGGSLKGVTQDKLKKYLDKVYGQAIVQWKVEIAPPLGGASWDGNGNGRLADEGLRLANYTDEMNALVDAYAESKELDRDKYYLFVVDKPESQMGKQGYMPRKRQIGFIFSGNHNSQSQLMHTIAHELGHGAFRLEHTFKEHPSLAQGSTDNLMDYTSDQQTNLLKYQWDHIHDPVAMIGWLQDDEDAMNRRNACKLYYDDLYQNIKKQVVNINYIPYSLPVASKNSCDNKAIVYPLEYWALIDKNASEQVVDENGEDVKTSNYVELNSPITLSKLSLKIGEGGTEYGGYSPYYPNAEGIGYSAYESAVKKWKRENNFFRAIDINLRHSPLVKALSESINMNGELNPINVLGLEEDVIYFPYYNEESQKIHYTREEMAYFLWGSIASKELYFSSLAEAITFASVHLNKKESQAVPVLEPWYAKALYEGWVYMGNHRNWNESGDFFPILDINMLKGYPVDFNQLPDGMSWDELAEVALVFNAGNGVKKVTLRVAKNAMQTLLLNLAIDYWLVQRILLGSSHTEALNNLDFEVAAWNAMGSVFQDNENKMIAYNCTKFFIDEYNKDQTIDINLIEESAVNCLSEITKIKILFSYLFSKNSPYSKLLSKLLKDKKIITRVIRKIHFKKNLSDKEITKIVDDYLKLGPQEVLNRILSYPFDIFK
ncbi:MAG: hypothetical protein MI749_18935 [Desulfovibrionales bacterium]|nr:hypothetical protein [Desulfovibrionales bacterium]